MVHLFCEYTKGFLVISFRDENLTKSSTLDAVEAELRRQLSRLPVYGRVVLDFRRVKQISSRAVAVMVATRRHVDMQNGQLTLTRVGPAVYEALAMRKLEKLFVIRDRLRDVLAEGSRCADEDRVKPPAQDEVEWIHAVV